jgi:hypothetical protein
LVNDVHDVVVRVVGRRGDAAAGVLNGILCAEEADTKGRKEETLAKLVQLSGLPVRIK